jgi:hypothetical protein
MKKHKGRPPTVVVTIEDGQVTHVASDASVQVIVYDMDDENTGRREHGPTYHSFNYPHVDVSPGNQFIDEAIFKAGTLDIAQELFTSYPGDDTALLLQQVAQEYVDNEQISEEQLADIIQKTKTYIPCPGSTTNYASCSQQYCDVCSDNPGNANWKLRRRLLEEVK